jgi:hypothetical protein
VRRTCLVALALVACDSPPTTPPEARGLEGLQAHLTAARRDPARAFDGWEISADTWRGLVTETYRDDHAAYAAELARRRESLVDAVRGWEPVPARWQYADDPTLSLGEVHARWILPVGRPGVIAPGIDAVFVHDGARWRVLVDLDPLIEERAAAAAPGCEIAYRAMEPKDCQDWAWSIAEGAMSDDAAGLARACRQSMNLTCGR